MNPIFELGHRKKVSMKKKGKERPGQAQLKYGRSDGQCGRSVLAQEGTTWRGGRAGSAAWLADGRCRHGLAWHRVGACARGVV